MKVLLIVLAVLFLIALLPMGIHLQYKNDLHVFLKIGPWKKLLDEESKEKKPESKKHESKKPASRKDRPAKQKTAKSWLPVLRKHWREILGAVGRILKAPTLDLLRLDIAVGDEDPAKCAISYGRICAAVGAGIPVVEGVFRVKKRQINVNCCFDRSGTEIGADVVLTLRVYQIFALAAGLLRLGMKLLLEKRRCQNESSSS